MRNQNRRTWQRDATLPDLSRIARIDGAEGVGTFHMTLATEGEASDGHVLSIAGGVVPERIPLLTSHMNDPAWQLGSVINATKDLKSRPARLRATGEIELGGAGDRADARRDLAHMIAEGHTGAVSIRWEEVPGSPPVRRVNLPSDHPYHVDAERETDERKLYGYYFDQWRALEGSVVSIGADPAALIGRARDGKSAEVRQFWRGMVSEDPTQSAVGVLRQAVEDCRGAGLTDADLFNAIAPEADADDFDAVELGGVRLLIPSAAATALRELEATADQSAPPEPPTDLPAEPQPPSISMEDTFRAIKAELDRHREQSRKQLDSMLDVARGRVNR